MKVAVIGTNGLLSDCIGKYCNTNNHKLMMYGLDIPVRHFFNSFTQINLAHQDLDYQAILNADLIVYAAGAGIQSNLKENAELIYNLNVAVPVKISIGLKTNGYSGTFVSFGSYFEIGENAENHCFDEIELLQSQRRVVNDYSVSKRMFSRYITSVEMPFITRHFILPTIYGENEAAHRLIPYTLNALKTNADISFTTGEQVRQYIYIEDVVEIIFKAQAKIIPSGLYNISGTETYTVKELVTKLFQMMGKPLTESVFGKTERSDTGMINLQLNGDKLYSAIDYKPQIKLIDVYDRY